MYIFRFGAALVLIFLAASAGRADDLRLKYVGKSGCSQGMSWAYGQRLDKTRGTYIFSKKLNNEKILMIIQLGNNVETEKTADRCEIILDIVKSRDSSKDFAFDCEDMKDPSSIVVGTTDFMNVRSRWAIERWRIDPVEQKFIPITSRVVCRNVNQAGNDYDDEDMVSETKKRTTQKKLNSK